MRLIDDVYAQIPRRLRGRLDIEIVSDPYYLRTEIIVTGLDETTRYSSPIEVTLDRRGQYAGCKIPDWFISHICSIPVDDNRLNAQLWDSLEIDGTIVQR